jgi:hypothetical protein
MSGPVQDALVAIVALGAAVYVVRRIVDAVRPDASDRACEHCEIGGAPRSATDEPPGTTPIAAPRPEARD